MTEDLIAHFIFPILAVHLPEYPMSYTYSETSVHTELTSGFGFELSFTCGMISVIV